MNYHKICWEDGLDFIRVRIEIFEEGREKVKTICYYEKNLLFWDFEFDILQDMYEMNEMNEVEVNLRVVF